MPIALENGLLLAVRNDSARQMADQALLDPLKVVRSRISAASESRVDAVYDNAFGDLLWDDSAAHFGGEDGLGCELHMFQSSRDFHHVCDGQALSVHGQGRLGGQ